MILLDQVMLYKWLNKKIVVVDLEDQIKNHVFCRILNSKIVFLQDQNYWNQTVQLQMPEISNKSTILLCIKVSQLLNKTKVTTQSCNSLSQIS